MEGVYYSNSKFADNEDSIIGSYTYEQSYIENVLRLNKGKKIKAYFSFPDSNEWKDKIFEGVIEEAGKDHLVISNPTTGKWDLILLMYLKFVEFDEPVSVNYEYAK